MHVEGGEAPETQTVEGERIAREKGIIYLNADGNPPSAVHANAQRVKQQIIKIRPLLKVSRFAGDVKPRALRHWSGPRHYMG